MSDKCKYCDLEHQMGRHDQIKDWDRKQAILEKIDRQFHKEFYIVINDGGELKTHYLDVIEWVKEIVKKLL